MSRGWLGEASLRCIPGLTSVPFFGSALRAAPRPQRRDRIRVEQSVPVPLLAIEPLHEAVMSFWRVEPRRDRTVTLPLDTVSEGDAASAHSSVHLLVSYGVQVFRDELQRGVAEPAASL